MNLLWRVIGLEVEICVVVGRFVVECGAEGSVWVEDDICVQEVDFLP